MNKEKLNEEEKTFISDLVTKINQQCKENEELKRSYARRENKWEKFKTQKDILSSNMSNYLCKYQNLKREYKIQNGHLHKYKQENQSLKDRIEKVNDLIDTILTFNLFGEECPLNFSFEKDSLQEKAQNIFYENDGEYCENNCDDCYKKCWLKFFERIQILKGE